MNLHARDRSIIALTLRLGLGNACCKEMERASSQGSVFGSYNARKKDFTKFVASIDVDRAASGKVNFGHKPCGL